MPEVRVTDRSAIITGDCLAHDREMGDLE